MSKFHAWKKLIAISATTATLILGGGGVAFAYWTSSGTSTGSGTAGSGSAFVVTSSAPTGGPLTPGGPSESVSFTVANPGPASEVLSSVLVTVANTDGSVWTAIPGCSAADFLVGTPTVVYGSISSGGQATGTVTVSMVDSSQDQDACKGVAVPLYFIGS